jgi:hypothetical protein
MEFHRFNPSSERARRLVRGAALFAALGGVLWLGVVLAGTFLMLQYSEAPGRTGVPPKEWPAASRLHPVGGKAALVMFVHPHCPCSSASIGELERIMASCQGELSAYVMFIRPAGMAGDWEQTNLWDRAGKIPGVAVSPDEDGEEARRFHAETSGQTVLYDRAGSLVFRGGITPSRGHSGDNPGSDAISSLLAQKLAGPLTTPVFGCALWGGDRSKPCTACNP